MGEAGEWVKRVTTKMWSFFLISIAIRLVMHCWACSLQYFFIISNVQFELKTYSPEEFNLYNQFLISYIFTKDYVSAKCFSNFFALEMSTQCRNILDTFVAGWNISFKAMLLKDTSTTTKTTWSVGIHKQNPFSFHELCYSFYPSSLTLLKMEFFKAGNQYGTFLI